MADMKSETKRTEQNNVKQIEKNINSLVENGQMQEMEVMKLKDIIEAM